MVTLPKQYKLHTRAIEVANYLRQYSLKLEEQAPRAVELMERTGIARVSLSFKRNKTFHQARVLLRTEQEPVAVSICGAHSFDNFFSSQADLILNEYKAAHGNNSLLVVYQMNDLGRLVLTMSGSHGNN